MVLLLQSSSAVACLYVALNVRIRVVGGGRGCRELWFGPTQWLEMTSAAVNDKLAAIV